MANIISNCYGVDIMAICQPYFEFPEPELRALFAHVTGIQLMSSLSENTCSVKYHNNELKRDRLQVIGTRRCPHVGNVYIHLLC